MGCATTADSRTRPVTLAAGMDGSRLVEHAAASHVPALSAGHSSWFYPGCWGARRFCARRRSMAPARKSSPPQRRAQSWTGGIRGATSGRQLTARLCSASRPYMFALPLASVRARRSKRSSRSGSTSWKRPTTRAGTSAPCGSNWNLRTGVAGRSASRLTSSSPS